MSAVAHEFETPAEVRPSGQNGINMAAAPPAREDGFSVSATKLASMAHPNCAVQSTVSVPHTRILSRPSAGGLHFSDAGRTAPSGSANGGKSHAVPYEGTVVHPSSRGRVSRPGAGAGVVASAAEAKAVMQLAAEKVKAAKVQSPQETAAADHRAMPAGGKKRVPGPRLTHARLQKAHEAYATVAAANGNGAGAVKTASRRRRNGNTAGAEGRRSPHTQTEGQGTVKATKAKQPVRISKKTQGANGRAHCMEPAASSQESGKRKTAAATTAEAAAAAKGSPKQKPAKKAMPAAAAVTTNAKSAEHGAAAQSQTEKSAAAAEAPADQACVDNKNIIEEATAEVDEVLSAPAVENEAAAAAKHADPEATDAEEEAAEQPEEDATEL